MRASRDDERVYNETEPNGARRVASVRSSLAETRGACGEEKETFRRRSLSRTRNARRRTALEACVVYRTKQTNERRVVWSTRAASHSSSRGASSSPPSPGKHPRRARTRSETPPARYQHPRHPRYPPRRRRRRRSASASAPARRPPRRARAASRVLRHLPQRLARLRGGVRRVQPLHQVQTPVRVRPRDASRVFHRREPRHASPPQKQREEEER